MDLLCTDGLIRGVMGPREVSRVWRRHIRNSLAVVPFLPPDARVIDLGSGGGLPGIPVALARPDLRITLLDGMRRRIDFLELVRQRLGLAVNIEHARAEAATTRAEAIICRAVAPALRLLPLAAGLLSGPGELLALKGGGASDEVAEVTRVMQRPQRPAWAPANVELVTVEWPDPAVVLRGRWTQARRRRRSSGRPRP